MKLVLSLLLAFVFLQTQTWALSGGPFDSGTAVGGTLTGTYAGVLVPEVAPGVGVATSIGLFTLAQPDSGFATGTISVFVNGAAFNGTITGVMDPGTGAFSGILDVASTFQVTFSVPGANGAVQLVSFPVLGQGSLTAEVAPSSDRFQFSTTASSALRIEGTAILDVFFDIDGATGTPIITQTTSFSVDGFKQSDT